MNDFLSNRVLLKDMCEIELNGSNWNRLFGKTVLITGAYGMLTSYIVFFLVYLNEKYPGIPIKIVAQGRDSTKMRSRFGKYLERSYFETTSMDICQLVELDYNVDYVIHAASLASPQYYSVCPIDVILPNVFGTKCLLDMAIEKKIKGFLLFSTGDIYGKVDGKSFIAENNYGVVDPLDIHNCYSESKRMAETLCEAYYRQKKVPVKIARIWHTYAPTMDVEKDPRVFSSFVCDVLNNHDITMLSEGMSKRCFCYITDAVVGFFKILFLGENGEAYNVCNSSQFVTIGELAEKIVSVCPQKNLKVIRKKRDAIVPYTENILAGEAVPDNRKLKSLGWEASVNIEEGFSRVISYLEERSFL